MKTPCKLYYCYAFIAAILSHITFIAAAAPQDGLKILNPKLGNWTKTAGKFASVTITVTPSACYTNYDILFEVSAQNTNLANSGDSLEAEFKFALPEGAILHDARLWMNNIPVKAVVYERDKAKMIYEALVARRIDPLIVYQNENNTYEARIFPILNPQPRKVQISYLLPNTLTSKGIEAPVDIRMLRSDLAGQTPNVQFRVANNSVLGAPVFSALVQPLTFGNYEVFTLPLTQNNMYLFNSIHFAMPQGNSLFSVQSTAPGEGYYQMMLMPPANPKKAKNVYVMDYRTNTTIDYKTLKDMVYAKIRYTLSPTDSFNVLYLHNGVVEKLSGTWIAGDLQSIDAAFANMPQNPVSNASLFLQSMTDAINFINNHGSEGRILMLSNSGYQGFTPAFYNQLISSTLAQMNTNYPVSVFDFNESFSFAFSDGSEPFYNNEYYFYNICALSGGSNYNLRNFMNPYYNMPPSSFIDNFSNAFKSLNERHQYDAVTVTGNSILHSNYKTGNKVLIPLNEGYMETGRYIQAPLNMQVNYYYGIDTQNFSNSYQLNINWATDTFSKKIWGYNYIEDLDESNTGGIYNNTIVNTSMQYDVLCEYTALLALEPDTTAGTVTNDAPTATEDVSNAATIGIKAIPNPFSSDQRLQIEFPAAQQDAKWELCVYNAMGQLVKQISGTTGYTSTLSIDWYQGSDELPRGIYILRFASGEQRYSLKVMKN